MQKSPVNMQREPTVASTVTATSSTTSKKLNRFGKQLSAGAIRLQTPGGVLEMSVNECSALFKKELDAIFPDVPLEGLLAIPTMQKSKLDLVGIGEGVEFEKDRCLENFMSFAQAFQRTLESRGGHDSSSSSSAASEEPFFFDYIDPCSGLAMVHTTSSKVFSEVDSAAQLLGYSMQNCGCCKCMPK